MCENDGLDDIHDAEIAQPLCTALQIALVELLKSWGICPSSVVGHSSGEIAAAYALGAFTVEQACEIAYYRGLHVSSDTTNEAQGAMLSVAAPAVVVEALLQEVKHLSGSQVIAIGCYNSPKSVTVTGSKDAIRDLMNILSREAIFYKLLTINVAYHSSKMQSVAQPYTSSLSNGVFKNSASKTQMARNAIEMFSSVTGAKIAPENLV